MDTEMLNKMQDFDKQNTLQYIDKLSEFLENNVENEEQDKCSMFMCVSNAAWSFISACEAVAVFEDKTLEEAKKIVLIKMMIMVNNFFIDKE